MISQPPTDSKDYTRIAHAMYKEFTTAVELTEQIRVSDVVWQEILGRMRYGFSSKADINVINGLRLKVSRTRSFFQYAIDTRYIGYRNARWVCMGYGLYPPHGSKLPSR